MNCVGSHYQAQQCSCPPGWHSPGTGESLCGFASTENSSVVYQNLNALDSFYAPFGNNVRCMKDEAGSLGGVSGVDYVQYSESTLTRCAEVLPALRLPVACCLSLAAVSSLRFRFRLVSCCSLCERDCMHGLLPAHRLPSVVLFIFSAA